MTCSRRSRAERSRDAALTADAAGGLRPAARDEDVGCSSLPAKQEKDPEGRMPLAEHLRELRNRLAKGMLAIVVVTVVAAFFYKRDHQLLHAADVESVGCDRGSPNWRSEDDGKCAEHRESMVCSPRSP